MDSKQASTVVTVTMLVFVLTGGFYVHKVPDCLGWIKYTSITFYCYRLLIDVQYNWEETCAHNSIRDTNCKLLEGDTEGHLHPMTSVAILFLMFLGYRLLAYVALRRVKAFSSSR